MDDECEDIEQTTRQAMQSEDPWRQLVADSERTTDSWYFWCSAFDAAVASRQALVADQIMRERLEHHEDFCAQPELLTDHALVLEQLGEYGAALRAIHSAIEDLPFEEHLHQIERRLIDKLNE